MSNYRYEWECPHWMPLWILCPPYCTIGPYMHNPSPQLLCPELRSPWETAVLKKEGFVAQGSVVKLEPRNVTR